jgi:hypothetical protein
MPVSALDRLSVSGDRNTSMGIDLESESITNQNKPSSIIPRRMDNLDTENVANSTSTTTTLGEKRKISPDNSQQKKRCLNARVAQELHNEQEIQDFLLDEEPVIENSTPKQAEQTNEDRQTVINTQSTLVTQTHDTLLAFATQSTGMETIQDDLIETARSILDSVDSTSNDENSFVYGAAAAVLRVLQTIGVQSLSSDSANNLINALSPANHNRTNDAATLLQNCRQWLLLKNLGMESHNKEIKSLAVTYMESKSLRKKPKLLLTAIIFIYCVHNKIPILLDDTARSVGLNKAEFYRIVKHVNEVLQIQLPVQEPQLLLDLVLKRTLSKLKYGKTDKKLFKKRVTAVLTNMMSKFGLNDGVSRILLIGAAIQFVSRLLEKEVSSEDLKESLGIKKGQLRELVKKISERLVRIATLLSGQDLHI